jgi:hypothetical protein
MDRWWLTCLALVLLLAGCENKHRATTSVASKTAQTDDEDDDAQSSPTPHAGKSAMPPGHGMGGPMSPMGPTGGSPSGQFPLAFEAPKAWTKQPPRSSFILGEYSLPKAEGDPADGRLTLSTAGGTVKANVERWRSQFSGKPTNDKEEHITVSGLPVTLVDLSGTFLDAPGPFVPPVERPDYRLLAAVIELGGQNYFVKCYGPAKTTAAHAAEFRALVDSLKPRVGE